MLQQPLLPVLRVVQGVETEPGEAAAARHVMLGLLAAALAKCGDPSQPAQVVRAATLCVQRSCSPGASPDPSQPSSPHIA